MARQDRRTEPLETREGLLVSYEKIEPYLIEGETRGRIWLLKRAKLVRASGEQAFGPVPKDTDILTLYRVMFQPIFTWAGQTRRQDRGPGGRVHVPWSQVRVALRTLTDDLKARVDALERDPDIEAVAHTVADAHHRFQWIHPFLDTNGRTGRVFDHYLLWITFGLAGGDFRSSPFIEYFPDEVAEGEYYSALQEADAGYLERLHRYYEARTVAALAALSDEGR